MHRRALSFTVCRRSTHYDTLGIRREATMDQVKTAFFAMSKEHHPDVPDHKMKPPFHEITAAYNVLRDPISRRAYDNTLPAPARQAASTLQSRHAADTAARLRRATASRPQPASASSHCHPHRPHPAHTVDPPFTRRAPSHDPLPGAHDRHHRHPGQRYVPPDPVAQMAAWAAQQEALREQKTRGQRYMASMILGVSALVTLGWFIT
ncbi:hypothetical protein C8R43DRAFT_1038392 [Mycena crocata]|nr:hypothetical protein C8R43DRAFT_1038392 [Mycena crocata]